MRQRQNKTRDAIEETKGFRDICPTIVLLQQHGVPLSDTSDNRKGKQRRGTVMRELLVDGPIPLDKQGRRSWASMSDEALVQAAKKFANESEIASNGDLKKVDGSLYSTLRCRGLLNRTGFSKKLRYWSYLSDDELVDVAIRLSKENGITGRKQLCKSFSALYDALRRRNLLHKIGFQEKQMSWIHQSGGRLIALAKRAMRKMKITGRAELQNAERKLYRVLSKRHLLDRIRFGKKQTDWSSVTDEELIERGKRVAAERGAGSKRQLLQVDSKLHSVLYKRGLLDRLGLPEKRRDWSSESEEDILRFAKDVMKEKNLWSRSDLKHADSGLYRTLERRKLLCRIGFESKQRWVSLSDDDIFRIAREYIARTGITKRTQLQAANPALLSAIYRRKLGPLIWALDRRPGGFFTKMTKAELLGYARKMMKEKGINGRAELAKAERGLYKALNKGGMLAKVGFKMKQRDWASMSDSELVECAKKFISEKAIADLKRLRKADSGLHSALFKRGLLDRIGFEIKNRKWGDFSDERLLAHAREFIEKNGIASISQLKKADKGLETVLRKRRILNKLEFWQRRRVRRLHKPRNWALMDNRELLEYARKFVKAKGIKNKTELQTYDSGLYFTLCKRKIQHLLCLVEKRRNWKVMSDSELIEHTKRFIQENGIARKSDLSMEDGSLYGVLRKRNLLESIGFPVLQRKWSLVSDERLIEQAISFMKEKGICGRNELCGADSGLYSALRKRKLLERIDFSTKLRDWFSMSDDGVVEYAIKFMHENGIKKYKELQKADSGLSSVLTKRKLMVRIPFDKKPERWKNKTDDELVDAARKVMNEEGISSRMDLKNKAHGLYINLRERNLLDKIFLDIEQKKQQTLDNQLLSGLAQAPEAMEKFGEGK